MLIFAPNGGKDTLASYYHQQQFEIVLVTERSDEHKFTSCLLWDTVNSQQVLHVNFHNHHKHKEKPRLAILAINRHVRAVLNTLRHAKVIITGDFNRVTDVVREHLADELVMCYSDGDNKDFLGDKRIDRIAVSAGLRFLQLISNRDFFSHPALIARLQYEQKGDDNQLQQSPAEAS